MASHHGNTQSEPSEIEQIITGIFARSLHIILESRCPYASSRNYSTDQFLSSPSPPSSSCSSASFGLRDKWFNLVLRDCPAALENIDFWHQSNLEPVIVDVILVRRSGNWDPVNYSPKKEFVRNLSGKEGYRYTSETDEIGCEIKSEKIIERWVLQYESKPSGDNGVGVMGNKRATRTSSQALHKNSILLLRSLYATVRLLPAYKVFRDLISSARIRACNLGHRVSSFVEPFTCREEADMQSFVFSPLDTSCGKLCLSVLYCLSELDIISEPSTSISPQVIHEYVGSPMAEPFKRFIPGPMSQCSLSSSPFGRRHSCSYDLYGVSPSSGNPSPSRTYSESHASMPKQLSHQFPPASLLHHMPDETPPLLYAGLYETGSMVNKLFVSAKDEAGKLSGVRQSSSSSSMKSFSRSPSRFSFLDNFDDSEFSGLLIPDDGDLTEPSTRPWSFDQPGGLYPVGKSQDDAAASALLDMLNNAPPLRPNISIKTDLVPVIVEISPKPLLGDSGSLNLTSSVRASSKTTADGFTELGEHKKMKELLLKQGKNSGIRK